MKARRTITNCQRHNSLSCTVGQLIRRDFGRYKRRGVAPSLLEPFRDKSNYYGTLRSLHSAVARKGADTNPTVATVKGSGSSSWKED
jgi:hypothetical protein